MDKHKISDKPYNKDLVTYINKLVEREDIHIKHHEDTSATHAVSR